MILRLPSSGFFPCKMSEGATCQINRIESTTICVHAFSDLSRVSPATFVYLLKECYLYGTLKATSKFRILQQNVLRALQSSPQPSPAIFVAQCLYVLPLLGPQYTEGFSHLLVSSFCRLKSSKPTLADPSKAKHFAAKLFVDILEGVVVHEERILIKIMEAYDIELKDIGEAICVSDSDDLLHLAKSYIEHYIFDYIESKSFMTAVTLSEHFSIHFLDEPFLLSMIENKDFQAASKWAAFMGKPMIRLLVQKYVEMEKLKCAYNLIMDHGLKQEFSEVCHLYKERLIKKLAEKGCWDIAEQRAKSDNKLLGYLVYLAAEAGYTEKVDELCLQYSLKGFDNLTAPLDTTYLSRYLDRERLSLHDILWIDEFGALQDATTYIEQCNVVGVDCEWKPNYVKGGKPNKVSIMQIATENRAFIFDMIKLYDKQPGVLDSCFKRIFCTPKILKLGYNFQCDLQQLSQSYGDLECFKHYEMLLDIQKLFNGANGGLSGLAEKVLGAGLNKTRRNSNWEQRPLSQNQIEYAALDAAVLVRIFHHTCNHSASKKDGQKWKSHIVSRPKRSD